MKKILVPTDFSAGAANALAYAYAMAETLEASITLLHVIQIKMDLLDIPIPSGATYKLQKEAAEIALEAQINFAHSQYTDKHEKVEIQPLIKGGNVLTVIKDVAAESHPHMIVMGARGQRKSELEKMVGTLSSAVAEHLPQPVLIVPEIQKFRPLTQLVYASELLSSDNFELWSALELLKPFSPIVRYVHVSKDNSKKETARFEKMSQYHKAQNPALQLIFYQIYGKDIDKELQEFCQTYDPDLMVVYHKHKNIFAQLFGQSHTRQLVSMVDVPVLVLKNT
jgi:nucleotide-binding universal stress UspA family protein